MPTVQRPNNIESLLERWKQLLQIASEEVRELCLNMRQGWQSCGTKCMVVMCTIYHLSVSASQRSICVKNLCKTATDSSQRWSEISNSTPNLALNFSKIFSIHLSDTGYLLCCSLEFTDNMLLKTTLIIIQTDVVRFVYKRVFRSGMIHLLFFESLSE